MKVAPVFPKLALSLLCSVSVIGCGATLNKSSLQAESGATDSTKIELVKIPRNPALPTYVLAIEPFTFRETFSPDQNVTSITIRQGGESLASQLTTALANAGNISVVDSGLSKKKDGMYSAKLRKGEVGPYIVRATVTEFTEVAEASSESSGGSLGWLGVVAGVAGAVSGNRALGWTGAGVAAANPSYHNNSAEKKGMVTIDFRLVDGKTGRIVGAFKSSGTFKAASAASGFSLFGIGKTKQQFAQSVLGQAVTAAMNDAVTQINGTLTENVKTAQK
ncbi:MAG: CsgG/HfaB family protein [Bdellovibrionota bacterium]